MRRIHGCLAATVGTGLVWLVWLPLLAGCGKAVFFPTAVLPPPAERPGWEGHDTKGDGKVDYYTIRNAATGRVDRIAYEPAEPGQKEEIVDLDKIPFSKCRHMVLILDGFGFELVKKFYDDGHLRMCYPPSRVISPYPSLTDLALADALGHFTCRSFEAAYYDAKAARMAGGSDAYLHGENEPFNRLLQYRAETLMDAAAYVVPGPIFGKEINDSKRLFDKNLTKEFMAYYVSSAAMGTALGAEGDLVCLQRVEQLVNQVIWETHGQTKVTILADHGHTYTPAKRVGLEDRLKSLGWRVTESLQGPKDVVDVRFGLVTYVALSTHSAAAVAAASVSCEGVQLASYADKDTVVVLTPGGGRAVVSRKGDRYRYEAASGDPLKLAAILATLKADADGYYGADDLFAATAMHEYPVPLQRIWRAHNGMAENIPDVIVSLKDDYYSGAGGFAAFAKVASTHGGLDKPNSTTFIMSTAGALPPVMQSADIPKAMKAMIGTDWPMAKQDGK
jgi:hypothetical protein